MTLGATAASTSGVCVCVQVRLLDGSALTAVFKAQEPLAAVRVYVQMNGNTPEGQDFTLLSPYPRQVYTELDMEKPLKELGERSPAPSLAESPASFVQMCCQVILLVNCTK